MVKLLSPWTEQLKNGKFKFRARFKNPLTLKYQIVSVTIEKDTPQARRKALRQLQKKADEKVNSFVSSTSNKKLTVKELKEEYLNWLETRELTYNSYKDISAELKMFVRDVGEDAIVEKMNTIMFTKYFNDMLTKKASKNSKKKYFFANSTIRLRKSIINGMFQYATDFGYLKSNPIDHVKIKYRNESYKKLEKLNKKFITADEYHTIIKALEKKNRLDIKDFIIWLYHTGMRAGEAAALRPSDVFKKGNHWYCKITGTLIKKVNTPIEQRYEKTNTAKTFAGNRTILIPKTLVDIYKKNKNNTCDMMIGDSNKLLLINTHAYGKINKKPMYQSDVDVVLRQIARENNIDKIVTTHAFRHTHISNLLASDVGIRTVMNRVGHSNATTTLEIYAHVTKEQSDKLAKILGA